MTADPLILGSGPGRGVRNSARRWAQPVAMVKRARHSEQRTMVNAKGRGSAVAQELADGPQVIRQVGDRPVASALIHEPLGCERLHHGEELTARFLEILLDPRPF